MYSTHNELLEKLLEVCSKLRIKTQERRERCRSSIILVNFKDISHLSLVLYIVNIGTKKCVLGS